MGIVAVVKHAVIAVPLYGSHSNADSEYGMSDTDRYYIDDTVHQTSQYRSLSIEISSTLNTACSGRDCYYEGPTIMINEVMLAPSENDGSIFGVNKGGEWIELYNPNKCDSVDISCYFLGNNAYDVAHLGGGFSFPQGTVVPPQGFCMVRGINAPQIPAELLVENGGNVVEVVVTERYCLGGGRRLWFPNEGGWFAFYDANGVPLDAISWCDPDYSCWSCQPCNPSVSECGYTDSLASYDDIPPERKNYITDIDLQGQRGFSFRRVPDGGIWQTTPVSPTYGTCNAECVEPPVSTCNGMAVATVTGGHPPYSYHWNDTYLQTTDTAFGLCAGTYTVTVTDAMGYSSSAQVTIEDFHPTVTHENYSICMGDSYVALAGSPEGGTYTGETVTGNIFSFPDSAALYALTYTYTDSNACFASADFTVLVNPSYDILLYDSVCQNYPYDQYGFHLSALQTANVGPIRIDTAYRTVNNCDSIVSLILYVLPTDSIFLDTVICEGEDFIAYGLSVLAEAIPPGLYQYVNLYEDQYGCDSIVTVNLTVSLTTHNVLNTIVCDSFTWTAGTGETYSESGTYLFDYLNEYDCSSTDTLHLTVHYGTHRVFDTIVCESFTWTAGTGETYIESGTYLFDYLNEYDCSSTDTLHLTVHYGTHHVLDTTVCESFTWTAGTGETYTESGSYIFDYLNEYGCSSTDTLHLTVRYGTHRVFDTIVCESFTWTAGTFETYTESGTYTFDYLNEYGCNSTDLLQLTVHYNQYSENDTIVCKSSLPLSWNGLTFTEDGMQSLLTQTSYGCDSVVSFTLNSIDDHLQIIMLTEDPCEEFTADLLAQTEMTNFIWSTGDITPQITVVHPGTYYVTASVGNCFVVDNFTVPECEFQLYLPNAITATDDNGVNDYFYIPLYSQRQIDEFEIVIYNRWGQMVFRSEDKNFRWRGDSNGKIMTNTTYAYVIHCTNYSGKRFLLKGIITVL